MLHSILFLAPFWLQPDYQLFEWINSGLANPIFDAILPYARIQWVSMPVYAFWLGFLVINFPKTFWKYLIIITLGILLSDQLSSHLIKPIVSRLRPCNDTIVQVRNLISCGPGKSFPSAHATNHFCFAVLIASLFPKAFPGSSSLLYWWAGIISFSQVYVGVHYPFDVLAGSLLGITIAKFLLQLAHRSQFIPPLSPSSASFQE